MKKQIFSLIAAIAMIGAVATGCKSKKDTDTGDTTHVDTTKKTMPSVAPDTTKKDTTIKRDTVHK